MLMDAVLVVGGLILLILGGDWLVSGAARVARRMQVSKAIVGVVLVGFGTSTPELAASIQAALAGAPDITVGNVVGSNVANILLIIGLAALIAPFAVPRHGFFRDAGWMILATAACVAALLTGGVGRIVGAVMAVGLIVYLVWAVLDEQRNRDAPSVDEARPPDVEYMKTRLVSAFLMVIVGIAVTILGARLLVDGAVAVARALDVSDALIGLTIVAVGTSLPELAASVIAARKGHGEIAYANIVGSGIYNIFGVLALTAIVSPLSAPEQIVRFDIWVMAGATLAMVLFAWTRFRIYRWEGALLFAAYAAYLGWHVHSAL